MNGKTGAHPLPTPKPALIIDAELYPRFLTMAEQARRSAPEVADRLLEEIERADLRPREAIPADVVTIGSTVTFRDGARTQQVELVLPADADVDRHRVSVLTPIGAALLGLAAGQRIQWEMGYGRVGVIEVIDVRR